MKAQESIEVIIMCSAGGPMDFEFSDQLQGKACACKDCEGKFKGIGKKIRCPSCGSDNVAVLE